MKQLLTLLTLVIFLSPACAQFDLNKSINDAKKQGQDIIDQTNGNKPLTNEEVIKGLKEALSVGTNKSASSASKTDGFYRNAMIKIPFPPEAEKVRSTALNLGMKSQVDKFVVTLNRAAEEASKEAAPVFLNAITSMSVTDGFKILKGKDNEATTYLQGRTSAELTAKFTPIVKRAIQKVELTKYWNPIISKYNKVPGVQKMNPDLEAYVTQKTLEGLFKLIAEEEYKIRKDPAARITDLLKRVFG